MADDDRPQSLITSGLRRSTAAAAASPAAHLNCPRCDSPSTKFCYYNNYSLSQPRHYCKSCRRYWTKGGALRNVPVGGGCRKNKKYSKSSSAVTVASSGVSGQKFLAAPPDLLAAGDLHQALTRLHPPAAPTVFDGNHHYHPIISTVAGGSGGSSSIDGKHSSLISSIESLSSLNLDLHLKLQQQRLASFFGGKAAEPNQEGQEDGGAYAVNSSPATAAAAAWFLDNTCTENNINDNNMIMINNSASNWNGISGWSDLHQFSTLP